MTKSAPGAFASRRASNFSTGPHRRVRTERRHSEKEAPSREAMSRSDAPLVWLLFSPKVRVKGRGFRSQVTPKQNGRSSIALVKGHTQ